MSHPRAGGVEVQLWVEPCPPWRRGLVQSGSLHPPPLPTTPSLALGVASVQPQSAEGVVLAGACRERGPVVPAFTSSPSCLEGGGGSPSHPPGALLGQAEGRLCAFLQRGRGRGEGKGSPWGPGRRCVKRGLSLKPRSPRVGSRCCAARGQGTGVWILLGVLADYTHFR